MNTLDRMQELEQRVKDLRIIIGFEKGVTGVTADEYYAAVSRLSDLQIRQRRYIGTDITDVLAPEEQGGSSPKLP